MFLKLNFKVRYHVFRVNKVVDEEYIGPPVLVAGRNLFVFPVKHRPGPQVFSICYVDAD